jgi:hypothetical protein
MTKVVKNILQQVHPNPFTSHRSANENQFNIQVVRPVSSQPFVHRFTFKRINYADLKKLKKFIFLNINGYMFGKNKTT